MRIVYIVFQILWINFTFKSLLTGVTCVFILIHTDQISYTDLARRGDCIDSSLGRVSAVLMCCILVL